MGSSIQFGSTSGGGGETTDATKPNATDDLLSGRRTGDTHNRIEIDADGAIRFGPGNGGVDVSLSRQPNVAELPGAGVKVSGSGVHLGTIGISLFNNNTPLTIQGYGSDTTQLLMGANVGGTPLKSAVFLSRNAAIAPLAVKGAASQTANLQEWQNSAGTVLASVGSAGDIKIGTAGIALRQTNNGETLTTQIRGYDVLVHAGNSSTAPGTTINGRVHPSGNVINTQIPAYIPTQVGLVVKGAASQTANLQEWQDSAGAVKASVKPDGALTVLGDFVQLLSTPNPILVGKNIFEVRGTARTVIKGGGSYPTGGTPVEGVRVDGTGIGFFGAPTVAKPTGVAVTAEAIHAALVSLGLIAA